MAVRRAPLVYSSTCATYGNPDVSPSRSRPRRCHRPYATKLYGNAIRDRAPDEKFDADPAVLQRVRPDPEGRLGSTAPGLRHHGRISGGARRRARLDSRAGGRGRTSPPATARRRDFIRADLVDAHPRCFRTSRTPVLAWAREGVSVKEFVEGASASEARIVREQKESRRGLRRGVRGCVKIKKARVERQVHGPGGEQGHAWAWRAVYKAGTEREPRSCARRKTRGARRRCSSTRLWYLHYAKQLESYSTPGRTARF